MGATAALQPAASVDLSAVRRAFSDVTSLSRLPFQPAVLAPADAKWVTSTFDGLFGGRLLEGARLLELQRQAVLAVLSPFELFREAEPSIAPPQTALPTAFKTVRQGSETNMARHLVSRSVVEVPMGPVYVSAISGSDMSGNGSLANPWRTLVHAMRFSTEIVVIDKVTDINVNVSRNVRISGSSSNSTWDCQQGGYALNVTADQSPVAVTVAGLTIAQCSNGALYANGSQLTVWLTNVNFLSNWGLLNGAVTVSRAAMSGSTVRFMNNSCTSGTVCGGGLTVVAADVLFIGSTVFSLNSAGNGNGGAINVESGSLAFYGSVIVVNNSAYGGNVVAAQGGGMFVGGGTVSFTGNSSFVGNVVANGGIGGGIYIGGGVFLANGHIFFEENVAPAGGSGGAMCVNGGNVTLTGAASFVHNSATSSNNNAGVGGGLYVNSGNVTLGGSALFLSNNAPSSTSFAGEGGGLYVGGGSVTFAGSASFVDNSVGSSAKFAGAGGGIHVDDGSVMFLTTVSFVGNRATNSSLEGGVGGGMYVAGGRVVLGGPTSLVNNSVPGGGSGGGLCATGGTVEFVSSGLFVNNTAGGGGPGNGAGGGIFVSGDGDVVFDGEAAFVNNNVPSFGYGGGLFVNSGAVRFVSRTSFLCNTAEGAGDGAGSGGGAYVSGGDVIFLSVVSFLNNSAASSGFGYSSGGGLSVIGGIVTFSSGVFFVGNRAFGNGLGGVGGGTFVNGGGVTFASSALYLNNSADGGPGGGIYLGVGAISMAAPAGVAFNSSSVRNKSSFSFNTAQRGGGIYIAAGAASVSFAEFDGNVATSAFGIGGGAVAMEGGSFSCDSCSFSNNSVAGDGGFGGAVSLWDFGSGTFASFTDSAFNSNSVADGGSGGALYSCISHLTLERCVFFGNSAPFGASVFLRNGAGTISGSLFAEVSDRLTDGGGIFANGGRFTISNATFAGNTAAFGAGVHVAGGVQLFSNCYFIDNTAVTSVGRGAALYVDGGSTVFRDCLFSNDSSPENTIGGSAVFVGGGTVIFGDTLFSSNSAPVGNGTIYVLGGFVSIVNASFVGNHAAYGGAIAWASQLAELAVFNSSFYGNSARLSGGAFIANVDVLNFDSLILCDNTAGKFGGAIALDSGVTCPMVSCRNCHFSDNSAIEAAGIAYFFQGLACNVSLPGCTAINNTAAYGPQFATPAVLLQALGPAAVPPSSKAWRGEAILVDAYGQNVTSWHPSASFQTPSTQFSAVFQDAVARTDVALVGNPGQRIPLSISVAGAPDLHASLNVTLLGCVAGEGFLEDSCSPCQPSSSYSFISGTCAACLPCPPSSEAICNPDSVIWKSGYWVFANSVTGIAEVYPCDPTRCLDNGQCGPHRTGILCSTCEPGYSEWNSECISCPGPDSGVICGTLALMFLYVGVQHLLAQSASSLTKILTNFLQATSIIMFPEYLFSGVSVFSISSFSASASKCPFPRDGYGVFLSNLFVPLIMAAMLWMLRAVVWFIWMTPAGNLRIFRRSALRGTGSTGAFLRTTVVLAIGSYQSLLQASFSYFNCIQVAGVTVVESEPTMRCDSTLYRSLSPLFGLVLAVVVLGPLLLFVFFARFRHLLSSGAVEHPLVVPLLENYSKASFFWEPVIALRKVVLMACFVAFSAVPSLNARRISLTCVVVVFGVFQHWRQPFKDRVENVAESTALVCLAVFAALVGSQDQDVRNVTAVRVIAGLLGTAVLAVALLWTFRMLRERLRRGSSFKGSVFKPVDSVPKGQSIASTRTLHSRNGRGSSFSEALLVDRREEDGL